MNHNDNHIQNKKKRFPRHRTRPLSLSQDKRCCRAARGSGRARAEEDCPSSDKDRSVYQKISPRFGKNDVAIAEIENA